MRHMSADDPKCQVMCQDLIRRAERNDEMSLAEKAHTLGIVKSSYHAETDEPMNIDDFPSLVDFVFESIYILYHGDLDGQYAINDAFGLIPLDKKKEDVRRLNKFFSEWREVVLKSNHKEALLNEVTAEARKELKLLQKLFEDGQVDYREIDQKEKSIVLHSKYLYLNVKEFFEENEGKPVVVKYHDCEIEINTHSLTHIMFRHYAGSVKQFDTNKSFHFDTGLDHKSIPFVLKNILETISSRMVLEKESHNYIAFRHRRNLYAIWIQETEKPFKGKQVKFNRLETYYPILDQDEINRILTEREELRITPDLSVFRRK